MNTRMNSNQWNKSFIFCWKMSGELATPIGRRLYRYCSDRKIIGFRYNCLFRFLKSVRKRTRFDIGLAWVKDGAPHSESFTTSKNTNKIERSTSFWNIPSCTLGNGYGREHIGSAFSFNSKSPGSVFQLPSVPSNNFLNFCNKFNKHYVVSSLTIETEFP